jgi:crossover junction endodeoxyribonuclease RusA
MSRVYELTVYGRARPQGSKTAFVNKYTGRAQMRESSTGHRDWRDLVKLCAQEAANKPKQPIEGPVAVNVVFAFARPKSHYYQRKSGLVLRDDAPVWVLSRGIGDIDKLQRSIYDAITDAGWIRDDSQIARVYASKEWTEGAHRVSVAVSRLAGLGGDAIK